MDVLADTNIILRRLHRKDPQHLEAKGAIDRFSRAGQRLCVTSQNLVELWTVCTRPMQNNGFGLRPDEAAGVMDRVEKSLYRLPDSDGIYAEWRRLVVAHGVSGKKAYDARLVATMAVHGITDILTFNTEDFARYPGITVHHPARL